MNFNEHWSRWIVSSIYDHFKEVGDSKFFAEGFERNQDDDKDWIECRVDGPFFKETTKGRWTIRVEVNILVCVVEGNDPYRIHELCGRMGKKFTCIGVYKYGQGDDDDQTQLGCLELVVNNKERLVQTNFGKVRPDTRLLQSSLEGHFVMYL